MKATTRFLVFGYAASVLVIGYGAIDRGRPFAVVGLALLVLMVIYNIALRREGQRGETAIAVPRWIVVTIGIAAAAVGLAVTLLIGRANS